MREEAGNPKNGEECTVYCIFSQPPGFSSIVVGKAAQDVTEARLKYAVVIASVHWGIEYTSSPTERQREVATALVRAGARAIIGHGPHIIQPMEIVDRRPVFYSLGNFLFEQPDPNRSSGMAVCLLLNREKITIFPSKDNRSQSCITTRRRETSSITAGLTRDITGTGSEPHGSDRNALICNLP